MSKALYAGIEGIARKVKKMYLGIEGVARKVKKGYIGINGIARLFFAGAVAGDTAIIAGGYINESYAVATTQADLIKT